MGMIWESLTLYSAKNAGIDTQLFCAGKKVISPDCILSLGRVAFSFDSQFSGL